MKAKYLLILLLVFSCREENSNPSSTNRVGGHLLFELQSESQTNISFNNRVVETNQMNALNYDYMYNGSGVSVGDFNLDGLTDIYFVANHLPNQLYLNKGNLKFEDITQISNTAGKQGFATGTTIVDINADGLPDIYVCKSGRFDNPDQRRNELFINKGTDANGIPLFMEEASKYKLDLPHYSTQASFFDFDRDGDLDLFLINHNIDSEVHYNLEKRKKIKAPESSDRLFENQKNIFVDVSEKAGIINDGIGFGLGLAIGDLNNDQWPDIIVGQDFASKDRIYLNQKNGTFKEVVDIATGHISNFSMGNDIADINNDGWLDFMSLDMVSEDNYGIKASMSGMNPERFEEMVQTGYHHQYMYNTLQVNKGFPDSTKIPYFSDIAALAGVTSTDWSWGPLLFDMDLDGDKDLFISNGIYRDFRNVDYIHYRERAEQAYLEKIKKASETLKAVIKQQHDAGLIQRMPPRKKVNYFYENNGDLTFQKRNDIWINDSASVSNGASYADLDNDGDLDLITNNIDGFAGIYKNLSRELNLGNYLKIKLNGSEKNKDGIGARITIQTEKGSQTLEQYVSRGFQSSVDNILHFGLGKETEVLELNIVWPDGKIQVLKSVEINQIIALNYADAQVTPKTESNKSFLFQTITSKVNLNHFSAENPYNDYQKESLLPHKMSQEGPTLAVGDINQDGLDDFYIGGAIGQNGTLYIQESNGKFNPSPQPAFQKDKAFEDVGSVFFDADSDGDLDLYVVSGSNEYELGSELYQDRIYINEEGQFKKTVNPFDKTLAVSGSVVRPFDFDLDGDLDLFVGGRQKPGQYPYAGISLLLRNDSENDNIRFTNLENPILEKLGMVTDAFWADLDGDQKTELGVVGEWMPITILDISEAGVIQPSSLNIPHTEGWWFSIAAADFDKDGDIDLVAGNLGLNSKYQASFEKPFQIHTKDFDQTGSLDIVLSYHQDKEQFPLRGKECSSNQMPFIKKKFPTYHNFASATLEEVYGKENLETALHYKAVNFATSYFENSGDGQFKIKSLPNLSQITATRKIITTDINKDDHLDILLFGNMYGFEVETPRQDAGYGLVLLGKGDGTFIPKMPYESGLYVLGDVADAVKLSHSNGNETILIGKNNNTVQLVTINSGQAFDL